MGIRCKPIVDAIKGTECPGHLQLIHNVFYLDAMHQQRLPFFHQLIIQKDLFI